MATPAVFPTLTVGWPFTRKVIWQNLRQESLSGKEVRIPAFTFPRYQWTASYEVLHAAISTPQEFQAMLGFVNSTLGGALPFYFQDQWDNAATAQEFGQGDGVTVLFQLVRAFGGFVEPVQSLNLTLSPPQIFANGALLIGGIDYTLGTAGQVTLTVPPTFGTVLTWTGPYWWLCRLDEDSQDLTEFLSGYYEMKKLIFTSIKL